MAGAAAWPFATGRLDRNNVPQLVAEVAGASLHIARLLMAAERDPGAGPTDE